MSEIDWEVLRANAFEATKRAYARYSGFPVGAAAITTDGRLVVGSNVENVSYGLTLCAECTLVGDLYNSGGGRLRAFSCADADGRVILPCGRCRQLLFEHGGPELLIDHVRGPVPLAQLLPDPFGPDDLEAVR
jgi:cytidine deaminase